MAVHFPNVCVPMEMSGSSYLRGLIMNVQGRLISPFAKGALPNGEVVSVRGAMESCSYVSPPPFRSLLFDCRIFVGTERVPEHDRLFSSVLFLSNVGSLPSRGEVDASDALDGWDLGVAWLDVLECVAGRIVGMSVFDGQRPADVLVFMMWMRLLYGPESRDGGGPQGFAIGYVLYMVSCVLEEHFRKPALSDAEKAADRVLESQDPVRGRGHSHPGDPGRSANRPPRGRVYPRVPGEKLVRCSMFKAHVKSVFKIPTVGLEGEIPGVSFSERHDGDSMVMSRVDVV